MDRKTKTSRTLLEGVRGNLSICSKVFWARLRRHFAVWQVFVRFLVEPVQVVAVTVAVGWWFATYVGELFFICVAGWAGVVVLRG